MQKRTPGKSKLEVSALVLGCMGMSTKFGFEIDSNGRRGGLNSRPTPIKRQSIGLSPLLI
ncbi:MAG: hypothetical protein E6I91_19220 [Chloroflexi bacterium]|nr:MAG: hypothetical protein E6I91_19220 [Chloroflexota bacterium]